MKENLNFKQNHRENHWFSLFSVSFYIPRIYRWRSINTLGCESQCMCGTKVKTAWGAAHLEVKQINATRSKTPWEAVCRIVIFRSVAVHLFKNNSKSPSGRVCTVVPPKKKKKKKTIYPRGVKTPCGGLSTHVSQIFKHASGGFPKGIIDKEWMTSTSWGMWMMANECTSEKSITFDLSLFSIQTRERVGWGGAGWDVNASWLLQSRLVAIFGRDPDEVQARSEITKIPSPVLQRITCFVFRPSCFLHIFSLCSNLGQQSGLRMRTRWGLHHQSLPNCPRTTE